MSHPRAASGALSGPSRAGARRSATATADDPGAALAARAARYPFAQPAGSYVFTRDEVLPVVDASAPWDDDALLRRGGGTVAWGAVRTEHGAPETPRTAVLGYGSNPAPETLARKLRDRPAGGVAVPVLELAVEDLDAVWSAHVHAGYVPATIAPSPGTILRAYALLLTAAELEVVNASESLGRNYVLGRLDGVRARFADGTPCSVLRSYVSLHGALAVDGGPVAVGPVLADARVLPALDEPGILRRVHRTVAPDRPFAAFCAELAGDPDAAASCTARLRPTARPFAWDGWVPLDPPPS